MSQADQIRNYIIARKIGPARRRKQSSVKVTAKEIAHNITGNTNYPNITQAALSVLLEDQASVTSSRVAGKYGSTTAVFEYKW